MRTLSAVLAWGLALLTLALTVWIVVPAVSYPIVVVAVLASELGLVLAALAFVAMLLALGGGALQGRWTGWAPLVLAALAFGLALWPVFEARSLASHEGLPMSWARYLQPEPPSRPVARQTVPFASPGGNPLLMDVYRAEGSGPRPALVVIHGGAWRSGDKGEVSKLSERMAARGWTVFDVQYRLEPAPNWREAIGDVKCAIGWVRANAARFGVDPRHVALLGRSAGAHLALIAGYTPGLAELPPSCPVEEGPVDAVIAFYGPTDLTWGFDHPANMWVIDGPATLTRFLGGTPRQVPEHYQLASPIEHVSAQTPPTLLIHGGHDQFVLPENSFRLADRLRAAGVRHEVLFLPHAQHAFDYAERGLDTQLSEAAILRFLGNGIPPAAAAR